MPLDALFGLAFATATPHGLTSRHATNSQAHSSKGTPSRPPTRDGDAPTACRRTVSGTLSLPSRGTFHHSLTVLFTIGHQGVFRLIGWSRQIQAGFHGPRPTWDTRRQRQQFRLQDSHPLRSAFPDCSPTTIFYQTVPTAGRPKCRVPQPPMRNPCRVSHAQGLASSAFARHYSRNHGCFLFLWVLRCFTSPRSLHTPYIFRRG